MKSPLLCYGMKALWLVAIILLINMGLMPLGMNLFSSELFQGQLSWLIAPLHYVAGVAGLLGLMHFVRAMQNKGGNWCGCNGKCK